MGGVYDVHTNAMQYPQITQPTHVRYERVAPPDTRGTAELMTNMSSLSIANQASTVTDINSNHKPTSNEPIDSATTGIQTDGRPSTILPPVPDPISSRYLVEDIIYQSPPYSNLGIPGPDGDLRAQSPNGFLSVANPDRPEFMNPEIIAMLPEDCKQALLDVAAAEVEWKTSWSTETKDGERSKPLKSYAWYP